jgi:1,2-phenylacetyl-CoA epoxidase catalytic subunit
MSEQEMNNYRLTSLEEPSDEMLKQLMHEVAEEARIKNEQSHQKLFQKLKEETIEQTAKWQSRIDALTLSL